MRNRVIDFLLYSIVPLIPIAIMAAVSLWCYRQCGDGDGETPADTVSVVRNEVHDTVYVEVHDTVPVVKRERVLCYVKVPADTEHDDSIPPARPDSATMAVVQREYSDDSTYTAYVSGLLYRDWPRLDSITVRQRTIINTITQTVTLTKRQSRFTLSAGIGYGYGIRYKGFEPFIGVTLGYRLLPP